MIMKVAEGNSPLAFAIDAASEDLGAVQGEIAVIIVSDGAHIPHAPAVQSAEALKKQFGKRLCIYTILVGDDSEGSDLLKKIAAAGQCGLHTDADSIVSETGMVEFVKTVFLFERFDSDGDGVTDDVDQCPNTPKGARVDEKGCWVFLGTFLFRLNNWDLKPEVLPALDNAVKILRENPNLKVEIQGHTCNLGSPAYNQKLSEKRAQAVYKDFVDRGIEKRRLQV